MNTRNNSCCKKMIVWTFISICFIILSFAVQFSIADAAEIEPNDSLWLATAIDPNDSCAGTFAPSGDTDWYKVTLPTQGRLRCSVVNPPSNIRPYITLYNRHADYMYVTSYAINDGDEEGFVYKWLKVEKELIEKKRKKYYELTEMKKAA